MNRTLVAWSLIGLAIVLLGLVVCLTADRYVRDRNAQHNVAIAEHAFVKYLSAWEYGRYPHMGYEIETYIDTPNHLLLNPFTGKMEHIVFWDGPGTKTVPGQTCYTVLWRADSTGHCIVPLEGFAAVVWVAGNDDYRLHLTYVGEQLYPPIRQVLGRSSTR
ncbi:MAG: hypothetical protein V1907_00540 [Candidatus Kerfeldbacteria bacterium]